MRKVTLKLKSFGDNGGSYAFAKKRNDPLLCRDTLTEFFTLPRDKSVPISFVLSGEELPNSYKVKFDGYTVSIFHGNNWEVLISYTDAKELLRSLRLANKEFWVSLYWEE